MNKKILSIFLACSWITIYGQDNAYFQTNFDDGIPQNFILIDNDEAPLKGEDYQNVVLNGSWAANPIDTKVNYAAFSLSRYNYDLPSENWMITPGIQIKSESACLRWDAKSVHNDYREDYKVMVSVTDANLESFEELYTVNGESYSWKTHIVSLADYVGKNIYIAFLSTSRNQFILAVDNLFIGELSEVSFDTTDESGRFSGDTGIAPVRGTIRNIGKTVVLKNINCVTAQDTYTQVCDNSSVRPDEELAFNFQIPVTLNEVSRYKLEAELEDGTKFALHEDSIVCSYYPRTLLVEKATACWCNNCTSGNLVSNNLKNRFKDEAIIIEVHSDDALQCSPYIRGITRWLSSYPSFIYNRDNSTSQTDMWDDSKVRKALLTPTTAKIDVQVKRTQENKSLLNIETLTEFALDYDNTSGRYTLGYAIVEKSVKGYIQKNSSSLLSNGEFYYLPYSIPKDIHVYHNVAREGSTAFKGVENSLPAQLVAGTKYNFTYSLTIPEGLTDSGNLVLVAFVMNSLSGLVLNTTYTDIPSDVTSITGPTRSEKESITIFNVGVDAYSIRMPEEGAPYSIELIALDGTVVEKTNGVAESKSITVEYPQYRGCYLMKINQLNYSVTKKLILY